MSDRSEGANREPVVAVVVPTHNRRDRLQRLVKALEDQESPPPFELVVVDDASADGTWEELDRLAGQAQIALRPLRLDTNSGPAAARNAGWRSTSADVIAFTDDDCTPDRRWLASLVANFENADVVQGVTVPDPAQTAHVGPWSHTMHVTHQNVFYETCNIAYRRDLLECLGGFDRSFRHPYGEDTDLAWRARERGARAAFAPDAIVMHDVVPLTFPARLRQTRRLEGAVQLAARHPQMRSALYKGMWFRATHPPALIAAAGLMAAGWLTRRSPAAGLVTAVAALSPYVFRRATVARLTDDRAKNLALIPLALIEDLLQVAVLTRGSFRVRCLVL